MRKMLYGIFIILFFFFSGKVHAAIQRFHQSVSPDLLEQIQGMFPEGREIRPQLLDYHINPNIRLFQEAKISVTFLGDVTAFLNEFGYFVYADANQDGEIQIDEILSKEILFAQVSEKSEGGALEIGDTVKFGTFPAGTQIGFYLMTHGEGEPSWTFYTIDKLNFDGHRHLAMMATPDGQAIALGIEDLPWDISDHDFNDILFAVSTDPPEAIQEVIQAGDIPGAASPFPKEIPKPEITAAHGKAAPTPSPGPNTAPLFLEGSGFTCSLRPEVLRASYTLGWLGSPLILAWIFLRLSRARSTSTTSPVGKSRERSSLPSP